jgi:hypothetical protein
LNSCSIPLSTEKWLSVSTTSVLFGSIQGEIISRPTWPPPGGVPMITGPHSPGVVVLLVVVDALVVVVAAGVVGEFGVVEDELVTLPVAAQSVEVPVVVPVVVGEPLGVVVVVVTVWVAVTTGVVAGAVELVVEVDEVDEVDELELKLEDVEVELPLVELSGRFGKVG